MKRLRHHLVGKRRKQLSFANRDKKLAKRARTQCHILNTPNRKRRLYINQILKQRTCRDNKNLRQLLIEITQPRHCLRRILYLIYKYQRRALNFLLLAMSEKKRNQVGKRHIQIKQCRSLRILKIQINIIVKRAPKLVDNRGLSHLPRPAQHQRLSP